MTLHAGPVGRRYTRKLAVRYPREGSRSAPVLRLRIIAAMFSRSAVEWEGTGMSATYRNYASDETVKRINSAGARLSSAQYVYYRAEAEESYPAILHQVDWIMDAIPGLLEIRGTLTFAVAGGSRSPYQVSQVSEDVFVVLIDRRAFYYLLQLCLRLQSLPPLAQCLETDEKEVAKSYRGWFLLDITKDIVFGTDEDVTLVEGKVHKSVFQAALVYILGHEIAHVSHGHLEFLQSSTFAEFSLTDEDRALTLQTLEMDADASATSSVYDVFEHLMKMDTFDNAANKPAPMLLRKHYVAGAFFALIYMDTLASNYMPKSHPIGYARFLTTSGVFQRIFEARYPGAMSIPDQVREAIAEAFVRLSGSLSDLGHPIASNVMVYDGDSEPVAMYDYLGIALVLGRMEPLHSRWARLRNHLEMYQRGGLLAPASAPPA